MNSDIANMVLDEAQNRINKRFSDSLFFKKMGGISNFQIENVIVNIGDDDLKKNFVGAFPSNYVYKFIDHASMISRKGKYPLIIANKDSSEKPGVYWWSILDIEPKTDMFFFNSVGLDGLKHFFVQDNKPIVEQILLGVEKMTRTDNKVTLCKIRFNLGACKTLSENEIDSLSDTARNFFRFVEAFGIKLKLRNFVNIWMVEERLQDLDSSTCGIFQLYFYDNLFNPDENSKIQNSTKLTRKTVETILNKLFVLDNQDANEQQMGEYANDLGITIR